MNKEEADRALDRLLRTMLTREEIDARLDVLRPIANEGPLSAGEMREYPVMRPILFRLVVARKQAGLNQTDAALGIGLSRASSLSDLETGRAAIKVHQLIALCGLYNVSPAWVIEGDALYDVLVRVVGGICRDIRYLLSYFDGVGDEESEA